MSRRTSLPLRRLAVAAAMTLCLTMAGCSGDDADEVATDTAPTGPTCDYPADPSGAAKEVDAPPEQAAVSGSVPATVVTNAGELVAELDADAAPCTVNSFVSLAEQGYFDGTDCHRLTTDGIFVLQCGDPTGQGTGGPGYSFADELSGDETYGAGTLAMANAGPDTNGSQFFVVYDDTDLPPSYAVFGRLDEASLEIVRDIAAKGTVDGGPDGAPKDPVSIESVTTG